MKAKEITQLQVILDHLVTIRLFPAQPKAMNSTPDESGFCLRREISQSIWIKPIHLDAGFPAFCRYQKEEEEVQADK